MVGHSILYMFVCMHTQYLTCISLDQVERFAEDSTNCSGGVPIR